jgi:hypothetical protein
MKSAVIGNIVISVASASICEPITDKITYATRTVEEIWESSSLSLEFASRTVRHAQKVSTEEAFEMRANGNAVGLNANSPLFFSKVKFSLCSRYSFGLGERNFGVQVVVQPTIIFFHVVQAESAVRPACYRIGRGDSLPWGKATKP